MCEPAGRVADDVAVGGLVSAARAAAAHDDLVVDQATWDAWEAARQAGNRRYETRRRWERARPVKPMVADLEAQLQALRWHNEELAAENDRLQRFADALRALVGRA